MKFDTGGFYENLAIFF